MSATKIEETKPATMLPSPLPLIQHPPPKTKERSFTLDDTLPLPQTLVRCDYTMDDISVDKKQSDEKSPKNKTGSIDSGVVQGTSSSNTSTPDHESESENVTSHAMESESRDFFLSSPTAASPAMESNSRNLFPSSPTVPSPAINTQNRLIVVFTPDPNL